MLKSGPVPLPPAIRVDVLHERGLSAEGFLRVRHVALRNHYPDGTHSAPYEYFMVERRLLDAVTLMLYRQTAHGPEVVLRSQLRPPLAFRQQYDVPLAATGTGAVQWEVPAGLMEPGEIGEEGLFRRAAAEALEEVGYELAPSRFSMLGPATSLSPGLIAEKLFFVCAELREDDVHRDPEGDGHAVEEHSVSMFVPLHAALAAVEQELVHDIKTELALHRLAKKLGVV